MEDVPTIRQAVAGVLDDDPRIDQVVDAIVAASDEGPAPAAAGEGPVDDGSAPVALGLSESDLGIIRRVVEGQTDHQIAQALYVSTRTVQNHLSRMRRAAGVARRPEFVRWAVDRGLV